MKFDHGYQAHHLRLTWNEFGLLIFEAETFVKDENFD